jgi:hypothetical protein
MLAAVHHLGAFIVVIALVIVVGFLVDFVERRRQKRRGLPPR